MDTYTGFKIEKITNIVYIMCYKIIRYVYNHQINYTFFTLV